MRDTHQQLIELLRASTDFCELQDDVLEDLASSLELKQFSGGTQIITEGTDSDSMFILVSGRLRVSRLDKNGKRLLYNEILPGECVGETGMILQQTRTADITALRDSILASLSQDKFQALIEKHPLAINKAFSQAIYSHLRHQRRVAEQKRAQSFGLVPLNKDADLSIVGKGLHLALSKLGKTHLRIISDECNNNRGNSAEHYDLDQLEADNQYILYQVDSHNIEDIKRVFNQVDQIVFVANGNTGTGISEIESQIRQEAGYDLMRKHLALIYPDGTTRCNDRLDWLVDRDVERVYPVKRNSAKDFESMSRFLIGKAVGVVLGGGGARGFAHLGVLRAFEEANIPIDILGGNSMGALIGATLAFGIPREDIHHVILENAKGMMSPSLPLISLLSNKNFKNSLIKIFGETKVESLWLPYFSAACNLSKANTTVLDKGLLWKAVLASNSPAGLLPPIVETGQLLVDGAILENVPVQAMRTRLGTKLERRRGNGTIIAIDVDVKDDLTVDEQLSEVSSWDAIKGRIVPSSPKIPGLANILMHVAHIGGLAQRFRTKSAADYYLEPPVGGFPMMAYKSAEQIIEAGYEYTVQQLEKWENMN